METEGGQKLTEHERVMQTMETLEKIRTPWYEAGEKIKRHCAPFSGIFSKDPTAAMEYYLPGGDRALVLNVTMQLAARITVAGLMHSLSNPTTPWIEVTVDDPEMAKWPPMKRWLEEEINPYYRKLLSSPESNFYTMLYAAYASQVWFGDMAVCVEEDMDSLVWFTLAPYGQWVASHNYKGKLDTYGRRWASSVKNLKSQFRGNITDHAKKMLKRDPQQLVEVIQLIELNEDADLAMMDSSAMPWKSTMIEVKREKHAKTAELLEKTGFPDRPCFKVPWTHDGVAPYGEGLGHMALGDNLALQALETKFQLGLDRMVDSPMLGDAEMEGKLDLSSGGWTWGKFKGVDPVARQLYQNMRIDFRAAREYISAVEERIGQVFFNPLFLFMLEERERTATEILKRDDEKVLQLGPVITNNETRLFNPLSKAVLGFGFDVGYFKPPPPGIEISLDDIRFKYVSQLAQAYRAASAQSIHAFIGAAEQVGAVDQTALLKVKGPELVDEFVEAYNVPRKGVWTNDEVQEKVARIQEAEKQAAMAEAIPAMADTGKTLAETPTGGENVLAALTGEQ